MAAAPVMSTGVVVERALSGTRVIEGEGGGSEEVEEAEMDDVALLRRRQQIASRG